MDYFLFSPFVDATPDSKWAMAIQIGREGEVTSKKELSYNYSYFLKRNLGTLVTLVTVTTIKTCLKK